MKEQMNVCAGVCARVCVSNYTKIVQKFAQN